MLIAAQYLVDRLRHPRSRADEVAALRRRFAAATSAPGAFELQLAADLRRRREQLQSAFAGVRSCSHCARGHPLPHGRYPGGHCCGAGTTVVFTDDEVAALRLSGTTPGRLVAPTGDHAGCAFRGARGCTLTFVDRPNICVRYICLELERELRARGDLRAIRTLCIGLAEGFDRLRDLHAATTMERQEEPTMTVMEAIRRRRSVRQYQGRAIPEPVLEEVTEALRLAPSACNHQPWRFVLVTEAGLRAQLARACSNQRFIAEAPVVVVGCAFPEAAYPRMGGYWNSCEVDVAIALDHLMLAAAEVGLGTCWIGAFDEAQVKGVLGIPEGTKVVALTPLGYPEHQGMLEPATPGARKPRAQILSLNRF